MQVCRHYPVSPSVSPFLSLPLCMSVCLFLAPFRYTGRCTVSNKGYIKNRPIIQITILQFKIASLKQEINYKDCTCLTKSPELYVQVNFKENMLVSNTEPSCHLRLAYMGTCLYYGIGLPLHCHYRFVF